MLNPAAHSFPWLWAPILLPQGLWVRSHTPRLGEAAGPMKGSSGQGLPLKMHALGDSIIAGVGVGQRSDALPACLADALGRRLGRQVHWSAAGQNGARANDVLTGVRAFEDSRAELLVLSVGLNDVTGLMSVQPWLDEMRQIFQLLRTTAPDALIVHLGLPPLAHFPALPQPLRRVLGERAQAFDEALRRVIAQLPGVMHLCFDTPPRADQFASDGYHPGPAAIRLWAEFLAGPIGTALTSSQD